MLIIYWLAVVFHLSLSIPMPPMDYAARVYTKSVRNLYFENFIVVNNRRTWHEAKQHCEQYNLFLGLATYTERKMIYDKFRQMMGKDEPDGVIWNGSFPPGENSCYVERLHPRNLPEVRNADAYVRNCRQTLGKDEEGGVLVGYFCNREVSYEAYRKGLRTAS
ncbi:hypothetical protein Q1695_013245 [Nippostrongylus brasiliensis]|nr:hypothetical protein Q1695_013245 [Nippostrongylus brasiliensis]